MRKDLFKVGVSFLRILYLLYFKAMFVFSQSRIRLFVHIKTDLRCKIIQEQNLFFQYLLPSSLVSFAFSNFSAKLDVICFLSAAVHLYRFKRDGESFLFTLVNPFGSNPVKITCKPDASGGIWCHRGYGPTFGSSAQHKLVIWKDGTSRYVGGDRGFTCPLNAESKTYFTGKDPLEIDELEVYEVNF